MASTSADSGNTLTYTHSSTFKALARSSTGHAKTRPFIEALIAALTFMEERRPDCPFTDFLSRWLPEPSTVPSSESDALDFNPTAGPAGGPSAPAPHPNLIAFFQHAQVIAVKPKTVVHCQANPSSGVLVVLYGAATVMQTPPVLRPPATTTAGAGSGGVGGMKEWVTASGGSKLQSKPDKSTLGLPVATLSPGSVVGELVPDGEPYMESLVASDGGVTLLSLPHAVFTSCFPELCEERRARLVQDIEFLRSLEFGFKDWAEQDLVSLCCWAAHTRLGKSRVFFHAGESTDLHGIAVVTQGQLQSISTVNVPLDTAAPPKAPQSGPYVQGPKVHWAALPKATANATNLAPVVPTGDDADGQQRSRRMPVTVFTRGQLVGHMQKMVGEAQDSSTVFALDGPAHVLHFSPKLLLAFTAPPTPDGPGPVPDRIIARTRTGDLILWDALARRLWAAIRCHRTGLQSVLTAALHETEVEFRAAVTAKLRAAGDTRPALTAHIKHLYDTPDNPTFPLDTDREANLFGICGYIASAQADLARKAASMIAFRVALASSQVLVRARARIAARAAATETATETAAGPGGSGGDDEALVGGDLFRVDSPVSTTSAPRLAEPNPWRKGARGRRVSLSGPVSLLFSHRPTGPVVEKPDPTSVPVEVKPVGTDDSADLTRPRRLSRARRRSSTTAPDEATGEDEGPARPQRRRGRRHSVGGVPRGKLLHMSSASPGGGSTAAAAAAAAVAAAAAAEAATAAATTPTATTPDHSSPSSPQVAEGYSRPQRRGMYRRSSSTPVPDGTDLDPVTPIARIAQLQSVLTRLESTSPTSLSSPFHDRRDTEVCSILKHTPEYRDDTCTPSHDDHDPPPAPLGSLGMGGNVILRLRERPKPNRPSSQSLCRQALLGTGTLRTGSVGLTRKGSFVLD